MTVSANYAWEATRDQVIRNSLWGCGQLNAGQSPTAAQITVGAELLQMLVLGLLKKGVQLRCIERYEQSITAVSSTTPYVTAPADTLDVEKGAVVRSADGLTDAPMDRITREEYLALTQKTTTGQPTMYFPEQTSTGAWNIYLYPIGDSANWTKIIYPRVRKPRDTDTGAVTPDIPVNWHEAITAGLAWKWALHYKLPLERTLMLRDDWLRLRDDALNDETERGNTVYVAEPYIE